MKTREIVGIAVALILILPAHAGGDGYRLVDRWHDPGFERRSLDKILVIGITEDREARRNFENKFVSHLRGRGIEAVTSQSLVADLGQVENEQALLRTLEELGVDAAISVRAVPFKKLSEKDWAATWRQAVERDGDLRELIDESLPLTGVKASKYGIEVALWEAANWDRIWAARTAGYSQKQMRKGGGTFVQNVMDALKLLDLL